MRENPLRSALRHGRPTVGTHAFLTHPDVTEVIGRTGLFDYVEFVAEYSPFHLPDLDGIVRAAALTGLGTMIKVDYEQRRYFAQRAVASGFDSVLFADLRTRTDVRHAVDSVRPDTPEHGGSYGARPHAVRAPYGDVGSDGYIRRIADTVVAVMVEKPETVRDLDEILAVGGVDLVQWGPADYAMSVGLRRPQDAERLLEVERDVLERSARAGVPARVEVHQVEQIPRYLEMGVRHFCIGWDVSVYRRGLEALGAGARELLGGVA